MTSVIIKIIAIAGLIFCHLTRAAEYIQLDYHFYESPAAAKRFLNGKAAPAYLYQRLYPKGKRGDYNYIGLRVYDNWQAINSSDENKALVWSELHQVSGEAANTNKQAAQFLVVTELKAQAGKQARYLELELNYFMPFHKQRVEAGIMNSWLLLRRDFPFGSRHDSDFLTLNGFNSWQDIKKNNPPDSWKKAHGDLDFNLIHDEILMTRDTVNIEIWKLVAAPATN